MGQCHSTRPSMPQRHRQIQRSIGTPCECFKTCVSVHVEFFLHFKTNQDTLSRTRLNNFLNRFITRKSFWCDACQCGKFSVCHMLDFVESF